MNTYLRRILILLVLTWTSQAGADAMLGISNPWIREAPPGARVMAGYMELHNSGDASITVTSISSPDFAATEIHRTVVESGVARMLSVEQLEIPASSHIKIEPGGLHIMLFEPQRPLTAGATVKLILHLEDGSELTAAAPVIRKTGEDHSHHH